jgi:hypothetical protein
MPSEPSRLSVPVTVRLCWTAQATAAGHQGHCCRCKSLSHGPSLRQREVTVGAARTRGRSNPRAGARRRAARLRRAVKPVARARGQSARRSVRTIRSLERADTPHEICSLGHADKQTIAFNGTRYGRLHEYHQISGGYCDGQMILIFAQARKRRRAPRAALRFLPLKQKWRIS